MALHTIRLLAVSLVALVVGPMSPFRSLLSVCELAVLE